MKTFIEKIGLHGIILVMAVVIGLFRSFGI